MLNNLNVTGKTRSRDQCEEDNLTVTRNRSSIDFYLLFVVLDFFVSPVIIIFFQNDLEPDPLFLYCSYIPVIPPTVAAVGCYGYEI